MPYEYEPLKSRFNEIRLLRLFPSADFSADVCCELEIISLNDNPVYTALSYCWADPPDPKTIVLHGYKKEVTGNLYAALCNLRDMEKTKLWWIDALCINQDDIEERSLQVLRMAAIYSSSMQVVAWIGSETPGQQNFKEYLEELELELRPGSQKVKPDIGAFRPLLSRKYWRRMWIVQEIALANHIWVVCGRSWVSWEAIETITRWYMLDSEEVADAESNAPQPSTLLNGQQMFRYTNASPETSTTVLVPLQSMTTPTYDDLLQSWEGLRTFQHFRSLVRTQKPIDFLSALEKCSAFLATDDRDKFYALLGLVYDGRSFVVTPDYKTDLNTMKAQMVQNYLQATKCLDVIIGCGHRQILDGSTPSWTFDWLDQGMEAKYALSKDPDPQTKFKPIKDNHYIPRWDGERSSKWLQLECLLFEQIDGLSSVYGRANLKYDSGHLLVQPDNQYPFEDRPVPPFINDPNNGIPVWIDWLLWWLILRWQNPGRGAFTSLKTYARRQKINELYRCLACGPQLYPHSLKICMPTPFSNNVDSKIMWLYDSKAMRSEQAPPITLHERVRAFFDWVPPRSFHSPELDLWLDENRELLINGETVQSLCSPKTVSRRLPARWSLRNTAGSRWTPLSLLLFSVLIMALTINEGTDRLPAGPIFTLAMIAESGCLVISFIYFVFVFPFEAKVDIAGNQYSFLSLTDGWMTDRRLRLAITGGGVGSACGWGGMITMVPGSARKGDHLALLRGCSTPVVLRDWEDGYQLIGIAHCEKAMKGGLENWKGWKTCKLY